MLVEVIVLLLQKIFGQNNLIIIFLLWLFTLLIFDIIFSAVHKVLLIVSLE